jgi:glucose/mannose-6-phosphate isomerase
MGGSGIPGDILVSYLAIDIPIHVVRDYVLPSFVDKKALVFIISYSGNTEESLACFRSALGVGCRIIGITSGGKLKGMCEQHKKEIIMVKKGVQPRQALPLLFFPMLRVLSNSKLIEDQEGFVKKTIDSITRGVYSDMGKSLAAKIKGKTPLIYSSEAYRGVSYRWKTQFNENSKCMAFFSTFSELNHNELAGYEHLIGDYYVIILQDEEDSPQIKKRMALTKELVAKRGVATTVILIKGACRLSKLFSSIHIGDWTTLHLAKLYGVDPTPVNIIEELKTKL